MYPRINYEMTEEDLNEILKACEPVSMIMLQCGTPSSPQENANRAWKRLSEKMGFDSETVQPIPGKGNRFFTAVSSETEDQRKERKLKEVKDKKQAEIATLEKEIAEKQKKLDDLKNSN